MLLDKMQLRKKIVALSKTASRELVDEKKVSFFRDVQYKKLLLRFADDINTQGLPTLGKLRLSLEKEIEAEETTLAAKQLPSENDHKRLALKEAVYEYYMDLPYSPDTIAVDYEGDLTTRRDDQDVDGTDVDLAPNKNEIYRRWMDKLAKLIREKKLSTVEYDEAVDRGTPQGGAFEKQLDRYRQDFMKNLWEDYYRHYTNSF